MSIIRGPFDGYTGGAIAGRVDATYDPFVIKQQEYTLARNLQKLDTIGQLWRDTFFHAMKLEYNLEESVAYANGAVDNYSAKIKEITNVKE